MISATSIAEQLELLEQWSTLQEEHRAGPSCCSSDGCGCLRICKRLTVLLQGVPWLINT